MTPIRTENQVKVGVLVLHVSGVITFPEITTYTKFPLLCHVSDQYSADWSYIFLSIMK
jgi:hypothetical protein